MYLRDLASSICSRKEDLADRDRHITVRNHDSNLRHNVLWEGKAKDLATFEHIGGSSLTRMIHRTRVIITRVK